MSLEKTLAENTAALQEQTAAIRELIVVWGKLAAAAGKVPRVETATAAGIPLAEVAQVAKPVKAEQTPAPALSLIHI